MSKVRINDLARELEVKSRQILDVLAELGLGAGKTHSSSLEEHEAEKVRAQFDARAVRPRRHGFAQPSGNRTQNRSLPHLQARRRDEGHSGQKAGRRGEARRPHLRPAPPVVPQASAAKSASPVVAAAPPPAAPARPEPRKIMPASGRRLPSSPPRPYTRHRPQTTRRPGHRQSSRGRCPAAPGGCRCPAPVAVVVKPPAPSPAATAHTAEAPATLKPPVAPRLRRRKGLLRWNRCGSGRARCRTARRTAPGCTSSGETSVPAAPVPEAQPVAAQAPAPVVAAKPAEPVPDPPAPPIRSVVMPQTGPAPSTRLRRTTRCPCTCRAGRRHSARQADLRSPPLKRPRSFRRFPSVPGRSRSIPRRSSPQASHPHSPGALHPADPVVQAASRFWRTSRLWRASRGFGATSRRLWRPRRPTASGSASRTARQHRRVAVAASSIPRPKKAR